MDATVAAVVALTWLGTLACFYILIRDVFKTHRAQMELVLEQTRELAHKLTAPEQAAIDHVFDKEQRRRSASNDQAKRLEVVAAVDRELEARGISPTG